MINIHDLKNTPIPNAHDIVEEGGLITLGNTPHRAKLFVTEAIVALYFRTAIDDEYLKDKGEFNATVDSDGMHDLFIKYRDRDGLNVNLYIYRNGLIKGDYYEDGITYEVKTDVSFRYTPYFKLAYACVKHELMG